MAIPPASLGCGISPDSCGRSHLGHPPTSGNSGCKCWPHEFLFMEILFITEKKKVKDI